VLDLVDCPDRRLAKAAAEMVQAEAQLPGVGVTAVLPRRSYAPLLGRLLHDRTADRIASLVSQIPHAAATIVPFDVRSRVEHLAARARTAAKTDITTTAVPAGAAAEAGAAGAAAAGQPPAEHPPVDVEPAPGPPTAPEPVAPAADRSAVAEYNRPRPSAGCTPIAQLPKRGRATVEGRVHAVEIRPVEQNTVLACEIQDSTGQLTALFYGRSYIPGLNPGAKVKFTGPVGFRDREAVMINPAYELLAPGTGSSPT
jgi:hypothetical protein